MANSKEYLSNLELTKSLQLGDMVEFPHLCYSHWGIYVGDGNVIHATTEDSTIILCGKMLSCSSSYSSGIRKEVPKGTVIQQNLFDIADKEAKKNNKYDRERSPLSPKKIVKKARSMLNKPFKYRICGKNCRHFATWCRYGNEDGKEPNCFCLDSCPPSVQVEIPDTSDSN